MLFDEIEKAHPDVFNSLLQLLDDGRLTDSQGRTVDFRNTLVLMTSNLGNTLFGDSGGLEENEGEDLIRSTQRRHTLEQALRQHFRPEFLNRIDDAIIFHPLCKKHLQSIVKIQLHRLAKRLEERRISLKLDDAALSLLMDVGYEPTYGARPLKRAIQRELENPLSRELLKGKIHDGQNVNVSAEGGSLRFSN